MGIREGFKLIDTWSMSSETRFRGMVVGRKVGKMKLDFLVVWWGKNAKTTEMYSDITPLRA